MQPLGARVRFIMFILFKVFPIEVTSNLIFLEIFEEKFNPFRTP